MCAFTEIKTFSFNVEYGNLEDSTTALGNIWADMVKLYVQSEHTGCVCWGVLHGVDSRMKLIIDWNTKEGMDAFESSMEFKTIHNSWGNALTLSSIDFFDFRGESSALDSPPSEKKPLAIMRFMFPPGYDPKATPEDADLEQIPETHYFDYPSRSAPPRPNSRVFTQAWFRVWSELIDKDVAVDTFLSHSWAIDKHTLDIIHPGSSFCASFTCSGVEDMNKAIEELRDNRFMKFLMSKASAGLEIDFLYTYCFDDGWHGSVTQTAPKFNMTPEARERSDALRRHLAEIRGQRAGENEYRESEANRQLIKGWIVANASVGATNISVCIGPDPRLLQPEYQSLTEGKRGEGRAGQPRL
ncbi:hypothetical protein M434DRAFT_399038 [Hypoxylon sp. CO27-5]|nr:hypothetical protein M434DRAFT_399038 [Hypoxylon sp. CO27-5]